MKNRGFLFLGGALLVGAGLGVAACGDDTGTGGTGATGASGSPTVTGTGTPSATGQTGSGVTGSAASTGSGIPGEFDCTPTDGSSATLKRTTLVDSGIAHAIFVTSAPDDLDRLYIVTQDGKVFIYENGALLPTPFIDVSSLVDYDTAEQGLLGLAFHPDYANNGRFFLHFSNDAESDDSTVAEFHRSADPHVAEPDVKQVVFQIPTQYGNHNGGMLSFGADGYLYINIGDGGAGGDPECDAEKTDVDNLLGKISRVDVNGTPDADGYPAAPGNPNGSKYYHIGLRNPWRSSFDPCTHDLYIGDVGQGMYEEIDHVAEADGPLNFGWPFREGTHDFDHADTCPPNPGGLTEPVYDYTHNDGCAVVGGYVYRSSAIPALRGTYFFSDNCSSTIWKGVPNGNGTLDVTTDDDLSVGGNVSSFGQDGRGNVYIVSLTGKVDKIEAN